MNGTRGSWIDGPLEIVIDDEREDVVSIVLRGELDLATAPALAGALHALGERSGELVIDLRELGFIDSTGLRVLLAEQRRTRAGNRALTLRRGPSAVHRIFELAGLCDVFEFED